MIIKLEKQEIIDNLDSIINIWYQANKKAHNFIFPNYWENNLELVKSLIPNSTVYIYKEQKEIEGFVGIKENYIEGLFVKDDCQRQGIGTKLLEYCKKEYEYLELDVYIENNNAVSFYLKNKFIILEEKTNKDTNKKEYKMRWKK